MHTLEEMFLMYQKQKQSEPHPNISKLQNRNILKHCKWCTLQNSKTYRNIPDGALFRALEHTEAFQNNGALFRTLEHMEIFQRTHCSEHREYGNIPNGALFRTPNILEHSKHSKWFRTSEHTKTFQMAHCSDHWNIPNGALLRTLEHTKWCTVQKFGTH